MSLSLFSSLLSQDSLTTEFKCLPSHFLFVGIPEDSIHRDQLKPEPRDVRKSHNTIIVFWEASDFPWEICEFLRG